MNQAATGATSAVVHRWSVRLAADLATALLLAVGAITARLVDGGGWIGLALLLLALVWLALRMPRSADPEDPREAIYATDRVGHRLGITGGYSGLGRLGELRMFAAAAALSLAGDGHRSMGDLVVVAIAACGLVLTVAVEPFVVRLLRLPTPYVAGLPGLPALPTRASSAWAIAPVGLLCTLLTGTVAATRLPAWLAVVIVVLGVVPVAALVRQVRSRRQVAARLRRGLLNAVEAYGPEFVLYTARPDDASYQLQMWLPYLQRAGRRFIIVTREELPAEAITPAATAAGIPVVCCRSAADLDLIMADTLRAAFYVNASSGNGALIRYHQLTHVYLGHGDSDKPPSYNPTHAMYDQIFTAGPAANRRYAAHGVLIDEDKFRVVGRPQVEVIEPQDPARVTARSEGAPTVLLYAPTWRGHVSETALSSLDRSEEIIGAVLDRGCTVIFRPHPFSYDDETDTAIIERLQARLADDAAATGRRHLFGPAAETELDAFGCMNAADVMISDVSSVVSDFLFSGKPFAMVAPNRLTSGDDTDDRSASDATIEGTDALLGRFVTEYPVAQASYLIDHQLDRLGPVLTELLSVPTDRLAPQRAALREDYLGDAPTGAYVDRFVEAVRAACDVPAPQVAEVAETDDGSTTVGRDTVRRNLDTMARTMITGCTAVLALAGALSIGGQSTGLFWAGAAGALVSVLIMAVTRFGPSRLAVRELALTGPRLILLLSAGVGLFGSGADQRLLGVLAGLGLLILVCAAWVEQAARSAYRHQGVVAVGLPELATPAPGRGLAGIGRIGLLVIVLGWILAVIKVSTDLWVGWLLLPAGVLVAVPTSLVVRSARHRLAVASAVEDAVPAVLERRAPQFCVYFGSGIGAGYQLGMWLPYFRRIGRPFVIITRSLPMLDEISELVRGSDVPVLYRATLRSLEEVVVPSMKVAFYVNNAVRNTHLIERRELTHVWLNHGDSEKPACFNPVHAIYDLIFAAGQAGIDRYARHGVRIPEQKFRIVGRPQTERIQRGSQPQAEAAAGAGPGSRTVLYAPTWQGPYADSRVYSLPVGRRIVEALLARGATVVFRAHPFNYRFDADRALIAEIGALLAADRDLTGRRHLWGADAEQRMTVADCFNASDAMITDVSAVVSDYLASGKPFGVVAVGRTEDELITEAPAAAAGYTIADDLADLDEALDKLLISDPLAGARDRMRTYYLGEFDDGTAADRFLCAARELMAGTVSA